jgi:periplasmic divalent cation tolerance protein
MSLIDVYVTFTSEDEARSICGSLLKARLIACANILPVKSMYWWRDNIECQGEYAAFLKTSDAHWGRLVKAIRDSHSYDVPCIIRHDAQSTQDYTGWVKSETK